MLRKSDRFRRSVNSFFGEYRLSSVRTVIFVHRTESNYGIYGPFS
jgi:hypothetical protein